MSEEVAVKQKLGVRFWIILGLVLLLLIGGTATGVVFYMRSLNPGIGQVKELPTYQIPMNTFTVNLKDSNYRRFLRLEITLETNQKKVIAEMNEKGYRIKDSVIAVLSEKNVSDLNGKDALKDELIAAINANLEEGEIIGLYFEQFIIQ